MLLPYGTSFSFGPFHQAHTFTSSSYLSARMRRIKHIRLRFARHIYLLIRSAHAYTLRCLVCLFSGKIRTKRRAGGASLTTTEHIQGDPAPLYSPRHFHFIHIRQNTPPKHPATGNLEDILKLFRRITDIPK